MGLRFTSKGDNLDAVFERCMLLTTAKRFIHLEAGGHDELKTCLSQERRATGDESIEASRDLSWWVSKPLGRSDLPSFHVKPLKSLEIVG